MRTLSLVALAALALGACSRFTAPPPGANANATPPPSLAPPAPTVDPAIVAELDGLEQHVTADTAVPGTLDEIKGLCQSSGLDVSTWARQADEPELQTYSAARASLSCKASFADVIKVARKIADYPKLAAVSTLMITRVDGEAGSTTGPYTQLQLTVRVLSKLATSTKTDTPEARLDLLRKYQRDQKSPVTTLSAVQGAMDDSVVLSAFDHEAASLKIEGVADDTQSADKFAKRIQKGALGIVDNPDTQTSAVTETEPDAADETKTVSVVRQKFTINAPLVAIVKPADDLKLTGEKKVGDQDENKDKDEKKDKKDKKDKKNQVPSP